MPDLWSDLLSARYSLAKAADELIRYEAIRHHEGRSFAAVAITARQSRGIVATSSICIHAVDRTDPSVNPSTRCLPRI